VAPWTWHREDVSIEEWQGHLVVYHAPAVQEQIARHIAGREAMAARQIVCRLHRLGALPADTGPVLDARQWAALAEHLPQPAAVFVARNEQVQNHFSGIQRLVVCDADLQQSLQVPIIQTLATGLSLTVRPTITVAGVRVVAKLCATVSSESTTSPVSDAAGQPLVVITTPHVTNDRSEDQREIPTGGAAIYRFGERAYALTCEVLDHTKAKP
jgi:hypothetical protein